MGRQLIECAEKGINPLIRWVWQEIKNSGRTHAEIARLSGVGANTMRKWFRGESAPKLDDIEAVVNVLRGKIEVRYV